MLQRGARLGSKTAAEHLSAAERVLEQAVVGGTLRKAHAAAEKQDWDTAISLLSAALRSLDISVLDGDALQLSAALGLLGLLLQKFSQIQSGLDRSERAIALPRQVDR